MSMNEGAGRVAGNTDSIFLDHLVDGLVSIDGIRAIVLGGSRALGTHTAKSDYDLGLYYDPAAPLDLVALQRLAAEIDDRQGKDLITPIGAWGPWINGGGWLMVQGIAVDLLYRDLDRVSQVVTDCGSGRLKIHYQPGHPHGFATHIYMGEVAICRVLWDPMGEVTKLKARTAPYPAPLRQAVLDTFLWEARFSVDIARKGIARRDISYVAGCCYRCVACLLQVLFALNERYLINEKGALASASAFSITPPNLKRRVEQVFGFLGSGINALQSAVAHLDPLVGEVEALSQP
jgi:hypothetical protein